ncbi:MAG: hypothetical protein NVSMB4_01640 [Acidimicrobiales bacterium]
MSITTFLQSLGGRPDFPDAACRGLASRDSDPWNPERGDYREARTYCGPCPARQKCLAHALTHDETEGMWGGLTPEQRRRLTRRPA